LAPVTLSGSKAIPGRGVGEGETCPEPRSGSGVAVLVGINVRLGAGVGLLAGLGVELLETGIVGDTAEGSGPEVASGVGVLARQPINKAEQQSRANRQPVKRVGF